MAVAVNSLAGIPDASFAAELRAYVDAGRRPGPFLTSLLSNDLRGAVAVADPDNRGRIADWIEFCDGHLPMASWGSAAIVENWLFRRSRGEL
ncbi:MAG: hypothetical protein ACM31L_16050 [Actinomycetota bacterium]